MNPDSITSSPAIERLTYEELCSLADELPSNAFHGELSEEAEQARQALVVQAFEFFREQAEPLMAALNQLLGEEESMDVEDILTEYLTARIQTRASHVFVFSQYYTAPDEGREAILAGALARLEQPRSLERIMAIAQWLIDNPPGGTLDDEAGDQQAFVG
jgi:hypothetical protein